MFQFHELLMGIGYVFAIGEGVLLITEPFWYDCHYDYHRDCASIDVEKSERNWPTPACKWGPCKWAGVCKCEQAIHGRAGGAGRPPDHGRLHGTLRGREPALPRPPGARRVSLRRRRRLGAAAGVLPGFSIAFLLLRAASPLRHVQPMSAPITFGFSIFHYNPLSC